VDDDRLEGGTGTDGLYGGDGNDKIRTGGEFGGDPYRFRPDRHEDTVNCGPGEDTVKYEKGIDKVAKNRETRLPYR
jgi:Ca2+-binding RTX toxin-like protein